MRPLRFSLYWKLIGFLLIAVVMVASLVPPPSADLRLSDKQLHFFSYALLGFWFGAIYLKDRFVLIGFGLIALGIGTEFLQSTTDYRTLEVDDMVADGLGVFVGLLMAATPIGGLLVWTEKRLLYRG